jgi:LPS O-antigen subunit length determinant protein (WzzB/FepE family)
VTSCGEDENGETTSGFTILKFGAKMPTNHNSELLKSQNNIPEDEIDLIDLLRVIWKWRYLIIAGTMVCALTAAIYSFTMPNIYSVDTIIEPGILTITHEGGGQDRRIFIDSPQQIKALIDLGAFENQILSNLEKQPKGSEIPKHIPLKTSIPAKSNALKIIYETANIEQGKKILNLLNNMLVEKYIPIIDRYKNDYKDQVQKEIQALSELTHQISKIKNDIKNAKIDMDASIMQNDNMILSLKAKQEWKELQIKNLQEGIDDSQREIDRANKNTDYLIAERNKLLAGEINPNNSLSSLIYINTIQQNISYMNDLKSRINEINTQIFQEMADLENLKSQIQDLNVQKENLKKLIELKRETLRSEIENLESQLNFKSEQIKSLEFLKNSIQNIQILKSPSNEPNPIKPDKRLIATLATMIGLFMMVCISFLLEYITENKKRDHSEKLQRENT